MGAPKRAKREARKLPDAGRFPHRKSNKERTARPRAFEPEFTRAPADIRLSAMLTWGVRYRITSLFAFESGVRVQGIDEANLLDAQIFGQLSWGSDRLRRAIHTLR